MCARANVRVCVIVCSKLFALQFGDLFCHTVITILQCLNEFHTDMTTELNMLNSVNSINRERVQKNLS